MKKLRYFLLIFALLLILLLVLSKLSPPDWLAGVGGGQILPGLFASPSPAGTPDLRTAYPGTVEVSLQADPDSPGEVFYTLWDANNREIFHSSWPLLRVETIYLPPGTYRWLAQSPVPTPPAGCYAVLEQYGYQQEGILEVESAPEVILVKLGIVVAACTPAP